MGASKRRIEIRFDCLPLTMTSYVFTLPKPLVDDFKLRQLSLPVPEPVVQPAPVESSAGLGGLFTCSITAASFGTVEELKEHYKSDWYKYNLKLRSKGSKAIVSEDEFDRLVEGSSSRAVDVQALTITQVSPLRSPARTHSPRLPTRPPARQTP